MSETGLEGATTGLSEIITQIFNIIIAIMTEFLDVTGAGGSFFNVFIELFDNAELRVVIFLIVFALAVIGWSRKPNSLSGEI